MSFQIGDVVRDPHNRVCKVGVVSTPRADCEPLSGRVWAYWQKSLLETGWYPLPMHAAEEDLIPHENPDPILAEFVAWRLTQ